MKSADMIFFTPGYVGQVLYKEDEYGTVVLPVTMRARGTSWSHGNRTIGCYRRYTLKGGAGRGPVTPENVWVGRWVFEWIDPRQINRTMKEVWVAEARAAERQAERERALATKRQEIRKAFDATGLPLSKVLTLLGIDRGDYKYRPLMRGDRVSIYVNADELVKLIQAAQMAVPEVRHAKVQAEVEAALALLGGV